MISNGAQTIQPFGASVVSNQATAPRDACLVFDVLRGSIPAGRGGVSASHAARRSSGGPTLLVHRIPQRDAQGASGMVRWSPLQTHVHGRVLDEALLSA